MSTFKDFLNEKEVSGSDIGQIKNLSMNIRKEKVKRVRLSLTINTSITD